jgi:hypothetical protein
VEACIGKKLLNHYKKIIEIVKKETPIEVGKECKAYLPESTFLKKDEEKNV